MIGTVKNHNSPGQQKYLKETNSIYMLLNENYYWNKKKKKTTKVRERKSKFNLLFVTLELNIELQNKTKQKR